MVVPPGGPAERWEEVSDFGGSDENKPHYMLDELGGAITLGPALLQPDGSVYRFGAVPPKGSLLQFSRYQYGGGIAGNVPKGAISVPKTSIPYVSRVFNRERAIGGSDSQTLEDAKLRTARRLRSRTRAVTAEDYEFHAAEIPGIARARCLGAGAQPGEPGDVRPGHVFVIVLPGQKPFPQRPQPDQLVLSGDLRNASLKYLYERSVLGIGLEVRMANITWVSVEAELRLSEGLDGAVAAESLRRAEDELYRYLNPYIGGPDQKGWPFGRTLYLSELYGLLQRVLFVESVESIRVYVGDPGNHESRPAPPQLAVPKHGVVCSGVHHVSQAKDTGQSASWGG